MGKDPTPTGQEPTSYDWSHAPSTPSNQWLVDPRSNPRSLSSNQWPTGQTQNAFLPDADLDSGHGTETDTESSNWSNPDVPGNIPSTSAGATPEEITAHLYWAYTETKSSWRRYIGRPVCRVHRIMKRHIKGKGKSGRLLVSVMGFAERLGDTRNRGLAAKART